MEAPSSFSLPPGFGFHPTDAELIYHYLKRKIHGMKIEYEVIPEVDIYKHEPWDLPAKCHVPTRDSKWHFFASRDKKYPTGSRSKKRATEAGYWKSTGKDRNIKYQNRTIGAKKILVFHEGRPPHGKRTEWIMHEYYINESECQGAPDIKDSYVLCRITKRDGWEVDDKNVCKQSENVNESSKQSEIVNESSNQSENVNESSNQSDNVVPSVVEPKKSSSQFESVDDEDIEEIFMGLLDPNFSAITEVESEPTDNVVPSVVEPKKSSSQFESVDDEDIEEIFMGLLDPNFSAITEVESEPTEGLSSFALNNDPFDPRFLAEVSEDTHLLFPVEEFYDILQSESQGFDVLGQLDIGS